MGVVGTLLLLMLPAIQAAREASRKVQCMNNQHQVGVAVMNFESAKGYYPPGQFRNLSGGDRWSWTVLILPYLEENSLYERIDFNQSITSPSNKGTVASPGPMRESLSVFLCPSARRFHATRTATHLKDGAFYTNNEDRVVAGLATIDCMGISGPHHEALDERGRPYGKNRGVLQVIVDDPQQRRPLRVAVHHITDGMSRTLLLTECTGRGWAKGMKGALFDGRNVGPVGKSHYENEQGVEVEITPAINMSPEVAWRNEQPFADHPHGVNCVMADGSQRFLDTDTDRRILLKLASRNGNERRTFQE
jgi:hypothetical protein